MIKITRPAAVEREFYEKIGDDIIREFRDIINGERIRLIEAGTVIDVSGYGLIPIQCRPEDQLALNTLALLAQFEPDLPFMDSDNVLHTLSASQMIELWRKGVAFISAVYDQSWAVKALDPITTDVAAAMTQNTLQEAEV